MASSSSCSTHALLLLILLFSHSLAPSFSWGVDGHYATCLLAQPLFSRETVKAIHKLLPKYAEGNLAHLCSWADEIRHLPQYRWSGPLHYIDTPDFRCNYRYDRDCHNSKGVKNMCAAGAINNYTSQLMEYDYSESPYNLTEALLFLAHIVGDIHQPLHVGFTGDLGGNTIHVYWYKRKMNLHHLWDDEIIDRAKKIYYDSLIEDFVSDLRLNITENWAKDALKWATCDKMQIVCPDIYASESLKAACMWAYRNATPGSHLADGYFFSRLPVVEQRLAQGGVRLAAILNRIFDRSGTGLLMTAVRAQSG